MMTKNYTKDANLPEIMDFEEAVTLVMQRTGKARRQARAALIEKCRQGLIPCTGINSETNTREMIPPEAWPKIN